MFQFPQIFFSSVISAACNIIIKALALSDKNLIKMKMNNKNMENYNNFVNIYSFLRKKICIFFFVGFGFLLFFWYFISCFGAVYKNTQIIYVKDCSISFALSLIYPFLTNLIPGIFRIFSLKNDERKCLYRIKLFFSISLDICC